MKPLKKSNFWHTLSTQLLKGHTPILKNITKHLKKYQLLIQLKKSNAPLNAVTKKYKNVWEEKKLFQNNAIIQSPEISNLIQKIKNFLEEKPNNNENKNIKTILKNI